MDNIDTVITPREKDLGGFSVRRVLPCASHPMVGPFIFFDHLGPANFPKGHGVDVRPHPHINLATVTYLFDGKIQHRDSLGSDQLIEPGDINWMTAGHGIVHSERTPENLRHSENTLHGIQCWVALPKQYEEIPPEFSHYAAEVLPEFNLGSVKLKLLLGCAFDHKSPVKIHSDLFYLEVTLPEEAEFSFDLEEREGAVYIVDGEVLVNQQTIQSHTMVVNQRCKKFTIKGLKDSHLMLLGGAFIGKRYIYWNFVSSSQEKIEQAKLDWIKGPGEQGSRFPKIPQDDKDFIPLSEEPSKNPKGTIM